MEQAKLSVMVANRAVKRKQRAEQCDARSQAATLVEYAAMHVYPFGNAASRRRQKRQTDKIWARLIAKSDQLEAMPGGGVLQRK